MINTELAESLSISEEDKEQIGYLHDRAKEIIEYPETHINPLELLETIEYKLQELWGFGENPDYHHHSFKLKGCECPYLDNMELIGSGLRRYNLNCKWHGNKVKTDV